MRMYADFGKDPPADLLSRLEHIDARRHQATGGSSHGSQSVDYVPRNDIMIDEEGDDDNDSSYHARDDDSSSLESDDDDYTSLEVEDDIGYLDDDDDIGSLDGDDDFSFLYGDDDNCPDMDVDQACNYRLRIATTCTMQVSGELIPTPPSDGLFVTENTSIK